MNSLIIQGRDPLLVQIPQHRRSVAHLPEALKGITNIILSNGEKLKLERFHTHIGIASASMYALGARGVKWDYANETCTMSRAFLEDLPSWVQVGPPSAWIDAKKGIPTMQACKAILVDVLELKGKVKKIVLESVNAQTQLDVNLYLLKGDSLQEAAAKSKSAYLAAELGEMLGGRVRIIKARITEYVIVTRETLVQNLKEANLPIENQKKYLLQEKFIELQNLLKPEVSYNFAKYLWMEFRFIPDEPSAAAASIG